MSTKTGYLIDTDIIIYWLAKKYPQIHQKMTQIDESQIFLSSVTVAELYFGAYNSSKPDENCELLDELTSELKIISFDGKAGVIFGKVKADLKKKGEIVSDSDLFIASTAISQNLTLVTNNERHFRRIDGLKIENWTKP
ncbi:PIN domain-containing protein [Candidatus Poribacteria bacterium]|nr:PIN domain-containing protein [Candidatus Poribacteria bacterium]